MPRRDPRRADTRPLPPRRPGPAPADRRCTRARSPVRPCEAGRPALRGDRWLGRGSRGRSGRQPQEAREQLLAVLGALFRVELDAEERALSDDGGDGNARVVRNRVGQLRGRLAAVGIREVRPERLLASFRERGLRAPHELLPADVRNLHAVRNPRDATGEKAQPRAQPILLSFFEQDLHPEADAEHRRLAGERSAKSVAQAEGACSLHPEPEGGDAWHDDPLRACDLAGGRCEPRLAAGADDGLQDRSQVPQTQVGDGDAAHSIPLVLGMPVTRGSIDTAWRSALANDLKTASAPWWKSRPVKRSMWRFARAPSAIALKKPSSTETSIALRGPCSRSTFQCSQDRPERSTTLRASASSRGK